MKRFYQQLVVDVCEMMLFFFLLLSFLSMILFHSIEFVADRRWRLSVRQSCSIADLISFSCCFGSLIDVNWTQGLVDSLTCRLSIFHRDNSASSRSSLFWSSTMLVDDGPRVQETNRPRDQESKSRRVVEGVIVRQVDHQVLYRLLIELETWQNEMMAVIERSVLSGNGSLWSRYGCLLFPFP